MDGELKLAGQVVPAEVIKIVKVVDVVNYDLVVLSLLKVIGHFKVLHPFRVQVVHDDLRLANFFPLRALFFKENAHTIGTSESVQVWQVAALEGKCNCVDEALVLGDAAVGCGEDGVVQVTSHAKTAGTRLYRALILMLPQASECVSNACCSHVSDILDFSD